MQKEKGISTLVGIIIIVAVAVILFGGVFAYQYFSKSQIPMTNVQPNLKNQNLNTETTGKLDFNKCIDELKKEDEAIKAKFPKSVLPIKVGECSKTIVLRVETRLMNVSTCKFMEGTGSAIKYTNGGYQVSYGTIQGIENSRAGDEINLCLLSIPTDCPLGDNRGKYYGGTNLRTGETWQLPDSEHMCGGA